jgi:3-deoxy-D-manno-octulosonate 8-phosphate phosphatase (KDO 8-P phosphatase)
MPPAGLSARLKKIKLLVCDVDGVLTDGGIWLNGTGGESKCFSVLDGTGLVLARLAGIQSAFLSGRSSTVITVRARECNVPWVIQGVAEKVPAFERICRLAGVDAAAAAFVGDDLIDLPVFKQAGVAIAVANAVPEVKRAADWVTRTRGGQGAVREIVERLLKAQGLYARAVTRYLNPKSARNEEPRSPERG